MVDKHNERHRYGQHYTPEVVARLLAAFAIRTSGDSVFDPSCGDGRLLKAARRAKMALAPTAQNTAALASPDRAPLIQTRPRFHPDRLFGIDRSDRAVAEASRTGALVAVADFFEVSPGARLSDAVTLPGHFDAIVGNPPYIRQELLGDHKSRINQVFGRTASAAHHHTARKPANHNARPKSGAANFASLHRSERPQVLLTPHGHGPDGIHIPVWSGRSDIYVYFFAHAARFLRPGGRLVFLTSSSWLDVSYGAPLQEFMARNFKIITVIESAVESFFADASVNTSITVLERAPDQKTRDTTPVRFIQLLKPLADVLPASPFQTIKLARALERGAPPRALDAVRIRTIEQRDLLGPPAGSAGAKDTPGRKPHNRREPPSLRNWGRFLRADDVFFRVLDRGHRRLAQLSRFASIRYGVKTGANSFFYVRPGPAPDGEPDGKHPSVMKPLESIAHVRRGMTTGANEFFYLRWPAGREPNENHPGRLAVQTAAGDTVHLESKYLRPVVFSLKEIPAIEIKNPRTRMLFFDCCDSPEQLRGTEAIKYIQAGEQAGIQLRPTCSARVPWYAVLRDKQPAPLIFPSKIGERWLVAINRAGVYEDKKLYGVFPRSSVSAGLLAALLNSTWARYYAEMTCRQLTGAQAIADIDVAVAEQILIPDPASVDARHRKELKSALGAIARRRVLSIFDEVVRPDRRLLDELVLAAIGFTDKSERREILADLYRATTNLVSLRLARSRRRLPQN